VPEHTIITIIPESGIAALDPVSPSWPSVPSPRSPLLIPRPGCSFRRSP
jgi:hypothetical protein